MIESVNNERIKEAAKLKDKKYQIISQKYLVEGEHLVSEAEACGVLIEVFALTGFEYNYKNITYISEAVMKKITSLTTVPSVVGVAKFNSNKTATGNVLLLDHLQDPGNMGTIMRSALAFNIDTIYVSPGTVYMYNPKVVRASEGAIFHLNIIEKDLAAAIEELKSNGYTIYTTDVSDGLSLHKCNFEGKNAIIIGNEGAGVDANIAKLADNAIHIEMGKSTESLNAGIATSIILYELSLKR